MILSSGGSRTPDLESLRLLPSVASSIQSNQDGAEDFVTVWHRIRDPAHCGALFFGAVLTGFFLRGSPFARGVEVPAEAHGGVSVFSPKLYARLASTTHAEARYVPEIGHLQPIQCTSVTYIAPLARPAFSKQRNSGGTLRQTVQPVHGIAKETIK